VWRCSPARRRHHKTLLPHVATPFSIASTSGQFMNWKKVFVAYVCAWFQRTLALTCLRVTSHVGVKTQVMCCSGMPSSLALQTTMVSLGHSLINHYILHSIILLLLLLNYVHTHTDPCSRQLEKKGASPPPPPAPGGLGSGAIAAIVVVACVVIAGFLGCCVYYSWFCSPAAKALGSIQQVHP
jgi:hypothetical protein